LKGILRFSQSVYSKNSSGFTFETFGLMEWVLGRREDEANVGRQNSQIIHTEIRKISIAKI
jgi:hypothetical protein